ncbi:MAG: Sir2 family NAD-dependent protein deacetylase [Verrucomicrobiota bacterium]|nr:Sir2 family NAD-dependent protein deacetylase [Limisphaera sp.]MDW8382397.1 Sir2 family NAD-dependent protein deacetylase [Verrucomicrobiota bacterium]
MNRGDKMDANWQRLVELLCRSQKLLIFTGAGISTASGIPDFRGPGGVWTRFRPVTWQEFLASHQARVAHWEYKLEGWTKFRDARPNAAHQAVVQLEQAGKVLLVVTQNIDGLHQMAGTSPEKLVELHGTNRWIECVRCGRRCAPEPVFEEFRQTRQPPRCFCGGWLKPATISFGQSLRPEDLEKAWEGARACDAVVALGSSLSVYPAADIPLMAARRGVPYAVINRGPTEHDGRPEVTLRLEGDVSVLFPETVRAALGPEAQTPPPTLH